MKSKGFLMIESIIMFVVLISGLMLIYMSANNYLIREKRYSNYDDIASIYDAYYVKEALNNYSNIGTMKDSLLDGYGYGRIIGVGIDNFFTNDNIVDEFTFIAERVNLYQMYFFKNTNELKACVKKVDLNSDCLKTYLDEDLRSYINTINTNSINSDYYLILEFRKDYEGYPCSIKEMCYSHYTWVAL